MATDTASETEWYGDVRRYAISLARIRSVSPSQGENEVAREVLRLLGEDGLDDAYTAIGLDPVACDAHGRQNAYAFLRGASSQTVVLLGHIDTVGTQDYGPLEPWATDPDGLADRVDSLVALAPEIRADLDASPGDWLFGRGVLDMKSGVAANIAVMRRCAQLGRAGRLPLSVVLLATPDEESESAGVLQAVRFLLRLRREQRLTYAGCINTDYTTSRYPGDPSWYVFTGTVGKLLPSFFVVGKESHVGDPFDGLDANLLAAEVITDLSMATDLCDQVPDQVSPPPVTLHASDLKDTYNVQLPFAAYFYLNVLTFATGPAELLQRLRAKCVIAMARTLARVDEQERAWLTANGEAERAARLQPRKGVVLSYQELYESAVHDEGEQQVAAGLDEEWERWPASLDKRERSLHLVHRLWRLSGRAGPAVVIYYSPPYYPSIAATPSLLHEAVADVVAGHPDLNLSTQEFYPYLSDMSYLRFNPGLDVTALVANMPVWCDPEAPARPGAYTLPLEAIRSLDLPVVDLGPYGRGAHQRGERVRMSRSFGLQPQLICEIVERLAERVAHTAERHP